MIVVAIIAVCTRRRRRRDPRIVKVMALTRAGCRGCARDVRRRTHFTTIHNNILYIIIWPALNALYILYRYL